MVGSADIRVVQRVYAAFFSAVKKLYYRWIFQVEIAFQIVFRSSMKRSISS
jgi:hypothetical protein